jgi:hypothetical protein
MQTRLTDRCPGSHLSTSFAPKAATNAAPSNRALARNAFAETIDIAAAKHPAPPPNAIAAVDRMERNF